MLTAGFLLFEEFGRGRTQKFLVRVLKALLGEPIRIAFSGEPTLLDERVSVHNVLGGFVAESGERCRSEDAETRGFLPDIAQPR